MLVLKKLTGLRSSLSSRQRFPLTFTTGKSEIPYEDAFIELSMWNSQKIIGKFEMGTSWTPLSTMLISEQLISWETNLEKWEVVLK